VQKWMVRGLVTAGFAGGFWLLASGTAQASETSPDLVPDLRVSVDLGAGDRGIGQSVHGRLVAALSSPGSGLRARAVAAVRTRGAVASGSSRAGTGATAQVRVADPAPVTGEPGGGAGDGTVAGTALAIASGGSTGPDGPGSSAGSGSSDGSGSSAGGFGAGGGSGSGVGLGTGAASGLSAGAATTRVGPLAGSPGKAMAGRLATTGGHLALLVLLGLLCVGCGAVLRRA